MHHVRHVRFRRVVTCASRDTPMVFFFTAKVDDLVSTDHTIYMGRDKVENDPLIKKSHPSNIWFHVDKHSSAHIYLQLLPEQQAQKFEDLDIPEELLMQLAQLTKANSIKASKLNNVTIIYTPVSNLHTDGTMDIGTVTFKNQKRVKRIAVAKKDNVIINRLNKTKREVSTDDFVREQQDHVLEFDRTKRQREREQEQQQREMLKIYAEQKAKAANPYADLMTENNVQLSLNEFRRENWVEEDFW